MGIDCEWKPSFGVNKSELALIQIATRTKVFIFDVIKLGPLVPHLWKETDSFLFNNCDILKLGEFIYCISCRSISIATFRNLTAQIYWVNLC